MPSAAVRIDEDSRRTAVAAARAALEKKAEEVVVLDLRGVSGYTDFLVIGSGSSDRQIEAIAESVEKELKAQGHRRGRSAHRGRGGRDRVLEKDQVRPTPQRQHRTFARVLPGVAHNNRRRVARGHGQFHAAGRR